MSSDAGRYLSSFEGATHEVFGGDPEEIVLRVDRVGEGASSLRELAQEVRTEADRYERLWRGGWRMTAPFAGGEARCRKTAEVGAAQSAAVTVPTTAPERLQDVVQGTSTLLDAAARMRGAAEAFAQLDDEGGSPAWLSS